MATNSTLKEQIEKKKNDTKAGAIANVKNLLENDKIKKRFEEILDKRAPQFISSIVNLVNSNVQLQKCEPMSVIASAMVAANLDLPIDKNLGYAWVIPYKDKASFQIGYKGFVQLALRTGQYKSINVTEVREGELISWNPLTEEIEIDFSKRESDFVIGYAAYFKLLNGFTKTVYWTREEVEGHAKKFSKTFNIQDGLWQKDFDTMAKKTVLKNLLSKWGILSIEMQEGLRSDNNVIDKNIAENGIIEIDEEVEGEIIEIQ